MILPKTLFLVSFIAWFPFSWQTRVTNPLGLSEDGTNVCVRNTQVTTRYETSASRTTYSTTYTACGFLWLSRCGRSRSRTVYYSVMKTKIEYVKIISCCSGWSQSHSSSQHCNNAICHRCYHGECVSPNDCQCDSGWTGSSCGNDINECTFNVNCQQQCVNNQGSYDCECFSGYELVGFNDCRDIDECTRIDPSPCSCSVSDGICVANCTNLEPGFQCSCGPGYQLRSGRICDDINECLSGNGCQQLCYNSPGNYSCGCIRGFHLHADGKACVDVDECMSSNGYCSQICTNRIGSYVCSCNPGFYLDTDDRTCSDHDECASFHGCGHKCNNFHGSYYCSCNKGYALNNDNRTCSDVDECAPVSVPALNSTIIPAGCDQVCHNTEGNYTCGCNEGFFLLYDGKRCQDINECSARDHGCQHICTNTYGAYECSCDHGYKLGLDGKSCEGLPCESIESPPKGNMSCSGFTTGEMCHFSCDRGYDLKGSAIRKCQNSSTWDGQRASCEGKSCGELNLPVKSKVFLPCYHSFGSSCTLACEPGYFNPGGVNRASCTVSSSSDSVQWDAGNFSCEEITVCAGKPCRHGKCVPLDNERFYCDCEGSGYKGDSCNEGLITLPDFPKLEPGVSEDNMVVVANPDGTLLISINSSSDIAFSPDVLQITHPALQANFNVTGHTPGIRKVSFNLSGGSREDFDVPESNAICVGRTKRNKNSIYTRFSLLEGDLPIGCHVEEEENYSCNFKLRFTSLGSPGSNDSLKSSGIVHIVTYDNDTVPLTMLGYDLSNYCNTTRNDIVDRLINRTSFEAEVHTGISDNSGPCCSSCQLSPDGLTELIQTDAFAKSFFRSFTDRSPLWLRAAVNEYNIAFDLENIIAYIVQGEKQNTIRVNCNFNLTSPLTLVCYRPTVNFTMYVEQDQFSSIGRSCSFAVDVCRPGVHVKLSPSAANELSNMRLMKDMAETGWKLYPTSFALTDARKYEHKNITLLGPHDLLGNFANFHFNIWWKGMGHLNLKYANSISLGMNVSGEAFMFAEELDNLFSWRFSRPLSTVFDGSAQFSITLRALGYKHSLTFHSSKILGRAYLGGSLLSVVSTPFYCKMSSGLYIYLDDPVNPFRGTALSEIIKPRETPTFIRIYNSISGGQDTGAQDYHNKLIVLPYQLVIAKQRLNHVRSLVPELGSGLNRWIDVLDEILVLIRRVRDLLPSSDVPQIKVHVRQLDDHLDTLSRALELVAKQIEPYKNRTGIETSISFIHQIKMDLPKTVSLSFTRAVIQQQFAGFRITTISQVCHRKICFENVNASIMSLNNQMCGKETSGEDFGLIVKGTATKDASLGKALLFPYGNSMELLLSRDNDHFNTHFDAVIRLFGIVSNVSIHILDNRLSFGLWAPMYGAFDALLNVSSNLTVVSEWESVEFQVIGAMNQTSHLFNMLDEKIYNETIIAAVWARRRIERAENVLETAKRELDSVTAVLKLKTAEVRALEVTKRMAEIDLREARLRHHQSRIQFNISSNRYADIIDSVCDIIDCNYTCLNGCVIPDICTTKVNVLVLERSCRTIEEEITVYDVNEKETECCFGQPQFKTKYTGDCGGGNLAGAIIGGIVGFAAAGPVGSFVGSHLGSSIGDRVFGCSKTYKTVETEPKIICYFHKEFQTVEKQKRITKLDCSNKVNKTRSVDGPAKSCCKDFGCKTKVIDSQCVSSNSKCESHMEHLQYSIAARNKTLFDSFTALQKSQKILKNATFAYEKVRIKYEFAVKQHNLLKSHVDQLRSAEEVANSSVTRIRQVVALGLRIAEKMEFPTMKMINISTLRFSTSSLQSKRIYFESIVASHEATKTVGFLMDFDMVERSLMLGAKTIISELFGDSDGLRKRRSVSSDPDEPILSTDKERSSTDYSRACFFAEDAQLYFWYFVESLEDLLVSTKQLESNFTLGLLDLDNMILVARGGNESLNRPGLNDSFLDEYIALMSIFKDENAKVLNNSLYSWKEAFQLWKASLEIYTENKGFYDCSGTADCIDVFMEGLKELYEFEDSPRAAQIKADLIELEKKINWLINGSSTMLDAENTINVIAQLLNQTKDSSVLCGGPPHLASSSQGEIVVFHGENVKLNCTAKNEFGLTYTWKQNDNVLQESTAGNLYLNNITKNHQGAYQCIVSNSKGGVVSNITLVKVHQTPRITVHPQSKAIVLGSQTPAIFNCNATADPFPTFQWFFQSPNLNSVHKLNHTKATLYIDRPSLQNNGYFYCEASNQHGTVISHKARLDILNCSVGIATLVLAFNITQQCRNASMDFNTTSPAVLIDLLNRTDNKLTNKLHEAIKTSLNISDEFISELQYFARDNSTVTLSFIMRANKASMQTNIISHEVMFDAYVNVGRRMLEKVRLLHRDIMNKTFRVSWNGTVLCGDSQEVFVYPLPASCPNGQVLNKSGFICSNCPPGSFSAKNGTCSKCARGAYQPLQGQTKCIPCDQNHTTVFSGSVFESDCIADCPPGSYSNKNRTCSECPRGTYQPFYGQTSCLPCDQDRTTHFSGTMLEVNCVGVHLTTVATILTADSGLQSTPAANAATSIVTVDHVPRELLEVELFYEGELPQLSSKDKQRITQLVTEKVSMELGGDFHVDQKAEASGNLVNHGLKVVLLVKFNRADKARLEQLLEDGVDIEYKNSKMHFIGVKPTDSPPEGNFKGQDSDEEAHWKIPVIAGASAGVGLIIVVLVIIYILKRKRKTPMAPRQASTECTFDNLAFAGPRSSTKDSDSHFSGKRPDEHIYGHPLEKRQHPSVGETLDRIELEDSDGGYAALEWKKPQAIGVSNPIYAEITA